MHVLCTAWSMLVAHGIASLRCGAGQNSDGQLGDGSNTDSGVPVSVVTSVTFSGITAGAYHTCGVQGNGTAWCWGRFFALAFAFQLWLFNKQ